MKTVSINVYNYLELSEKAKQKAYFRWLETEPERWVTEGLREALEILEDYGVKLTKWQFDESNYWFRLDTSSDLASGIEITELKGLTALKKAMRLYTELSTFPHRYYSTEPGDIVYRDSIVLFHNEGDLFCMDSFCMYSFCIALKELINKKDLNLSLYDYLSAGMDNLFKVVQREYADQTSQETFEDTSENNAWFYFENGTFYACV